MDNPVRAVHRSGNPLVASETGGHDRSMDSGPPVPRPRRLPRPLLRRFPGRAVRTAVLATVVVLGPAGPVGPAVPAAAQDITQDAPQDSSQNAPSAAPVGPAPATVPAATHRRPVPGVVLVAADIPAQNWKPGHRGVDLDAGAGTPVRASEAGTVRFAGVVAGTPTVSVDHGNGLRTTYEPVLAQVRAGDRVEQGTVLGTLADTAALPETARREAGLHWGAVLADPAERYVDPMTLLAPVRVRLWR